MGDQKNTNLATEGERREVIDILTRKPLVKSQIKDFHNDLPLDARMLAKGFGIEVVEARLSKRLAGFLNHAKTDSGWEIVINSEIPEEHKRWAIIHELCHWILDMDCSPPEFLEERIPPLLIGNAQDTYNHYRVVVEHRSIDRFGNLIVSAFLDYDPFIDQNGVQRSERMVNWLAGYILIPTCRLSQELEEGRTAQLIAEIFGVPRAVAAMQMYLFFERQRTAMNN